MYVCMNVRTYVGTYVRTYVRTSVCMYVGRFVFMYVCMHVCVCACVGDTERERECGRNIISDKTKYMHSEDSDKLVYLSDLISLHLRYMDNEHNTSLSY